MFSSKDINKAWDEVIDPFNQNCLMIERGEHKEIFVMIRISGKIDFLAFEGKLT
jgi:hypothetical protein